MSDECNNFIIKITRLNEKTINSNETLFFTHLGKRSNYLNVLKLQHSFQYEGVAAFL